MGSKLHCHLHGWQADDSTLEFTEWSLRAQHCALDLSPVLQRWTIRWYYLPKKGSLVREMLLHLRPAETWMNSLSGALLEEVKRKEESWECGWQLQGEMNEQLIQVSSWPRIWALGSTKTKNLKDFIKNGINKIVEMNIAEEKGLQ